VPLTSGLGHGRQQMAPTAPIAACLGSGWPNQHSWAEHDEDQHRRRVMPSSIFHSGQPRSVSA